MSSLKTAESFGNRTALQSQFQEPQSTSSSLACYSLPGSDLLQHFPFSHFWVVVVTKNAFNVIKGSSSSSTANAGQTMANSADKLCSLIPLPLPCCCSCLCSLPRLSCPSRVINLPCAETLVSGCVLMNRRHHPTSSDGYLLALLGRRG